MEGITPMAFMRFLVSQGFKVNVVNVDFETVDDGNIDEFEEFMENEKSEKN
jgi:hypothetical protein